MRPHHVFRRALIEATLISLIILVLFYYWFAVADRYIVFLYGHSASGIPFTQPFDALTSSRYWMAGLVAAGLVLVLYTAAHWVGGRLAARRDHTFATSDWWRVWALCVVPLAMGIPAITMTVNRPTLPFPLAAACVASTLAGLALALLPGRWAAQRPTDLVWLAVDGWGLIPILVLMRAIELPDRGLSVSPAVAWSLAIGSVIGGVVWLVIISVLRQWGGYAIPGAAAVFLSGLTQSYVMMPLAHYLMAGPRGLRYISNSANFFATNPWLQFVAIATVIGLALAATWFRRWLARRDMSGAKPVAPVGME